MMKTSPTYSVMVEGASRPAAALATPLHLAILVFSIAYAYVLQALPQLAFEDRVAYLRYAEFSHIALLENLAAGIPAVMVNEPLWLLINVGLAQLLRPEGVVRTVIFSGAFAFSYVLLKSNPRRALWLIVFLLTPSILKNFITHLRQGLAMAIFFGGYFAGGRARSWVLMALAPLVHASFFFVLPVVLLLQTLRRMRLAIDVRLLSIGIYAIIASVFLKVLAEAAGARQARLYQFEMGEGSGLGFMFWLAIASLLVTQGRRFIDEHDLAFGILISYLASYFFVEVTARIFESGLPIVLIAGLSLIGWRRQVFVGAYLAFSLLQWTIRLNSAAPF